VPITKKMKLFKQFLCVTLILLSFASFTKVECNHSIIEERHDLFMLAVMSYLYSDLPTHPRPGADIAGLIAWDVENEQETPEFVIERNRNFERHSNISHAEIMVIEKAIAKRRPFNEPLSATNAEKSQRYSFLLANATLYCSLEPCLFCQTGMSLSRIPNAFYFMEDVVMRNEIQQFCSSLPDRILGRKKTQCVLSTLPLAIQANNDMREILLKEPVPTTAHFVKYLEEYGSSIYTTAYEQLSGYEVQHSQNKELLENLQFSLGIKK